MGLTLREMSLLAEGKAKRDRESWRKQIAIAHLTETLARQKRIPDLVELLETLKANEPLTPKQKRESFIERMDAIAAATARKFGKKK